MHLLWTIIIGFVAGVIAKLVSPGMLFALGSGAACAETIGGALPRPTRAAIRPLHSARRGAGRRPERAQGEGQLRGGHRTGAQRNTAGRGVRTEAASL